MDTALEAPARPEGADEPESTTGQPLPADRRSSRPWVVALLLLYLFGLALFNGVVAVAHPEIPEDEAVRLAQFPRQVHGTVRAADGGPLENVTVHSLHDPDQATVTDAEGRYTLDGLASGFNALRFAHPDHANLTLRLFLLRPETADVTLWPADGTDDRQEDHASYLAQVGLKRALGTVILALATLTLAGAVSAFRRRRRGLVVTGCVAGLVGALPASPLSLLVAPVALFLALRERDDWD